MPNFCHAGGTGSCHYNNFRHRLWRQSWHYDKYWLSVLSQQQNVGVLDRINVNYILLQQEVHVFVCRGNQTSYITDELIGPWEIRLQYLINNVQTHIKDR